MSVCLLRKELAKRDVEGLSWRGGIDDWPSIVVERGRFGTENKAIVSTVYRNGGYNMD
jgi:hypothetical protein